MGCRPVAHLGGVEALCKGLEAFWARAWSGVWLGEAGGAGEAVLAVKVVGLAGEGLHGVREEPGDLHTIPGMASERARPRAQEKASTYAP